MSCEGNRLKSVNVVDCIDHHVLGLGLEGYTFIYNCVYYNIQLNNIFNSIIIRLLKYCVQNNMNLTVICEWSVEELGPTER